MSAEPIVQRHTHVGRSAIVVGTLGTIITSGFTYGCLADVPPSTQIRPIGCIAFACLLSGGFFLYGAAAAQRAIHLKEKRAEILAGFLMCILPGASALIIFLFMKWYLRLSFAP